MKMKNKIYILLIICVPYMICAMTNPPFEHQNLQVDVTSFIKWTSLNYGFDKNSIDPPPNDNCEDASPVMLTHGIPVTFTGTTIGATSSEAEITAVVWEAVTLTGDCNYLYIDYCGTPQGVQGLVFSEIKGSCSSPSLSGFYLNEICDDGNRKFFFYNLPAGDYYIPVNAEMGVTPGEYTMNVLAMECPPPPPNDNCSDVSPTLLAHDIQVTFTGTTVSATNNHGEELAVVWEAVTLTEECNNLTIDFCGTPMNTQTDIAAWITDNCSTFDPIEGFPDARNVCGDGNFTIRYYDLPAGTYYIPVMAALNNQPGSYTMSVIASGCPPPPSNDNCSDVTPIPLLSGEEVIFTGTTAGATASSNESAVFGIGLVWEAVILTEDCSNLEINFCGTAPHIMSSGMIKITDTCPASNTFDAFLYDYFSCGDNNLTVKYTNLPAGTYYIPVMADRQVGENIPGEYTMTVRSEACPLPPENCEDYKVSSMGDFNSVMHDTATDIPIGDSGFSIDGVEVNLGEINETEVAIHFLNDDNGTPGEIIDVVAGTVTASEFVGSSMFNGDFYKYTVEFENPYSFNPNTVYWMMVEAPSILTDQTLWENSPEPSPIGGPDYFWINFPGGGGDWWINNYNSVFSFICSEMDASEIDFNDFHYYPNPVEDKLYLSSKNTITKVEIYNLAGVKSETKTLNSTQAVIDTRHLRAGTYLFQILLSNGAIETFKVLKK